MRGRVNEERKRRETKVRGMWEREGTERGEERIDAWKGN